MQRRELILRMSQGESLVGVSLDREFVLGQSRFDRDQLPGWLVRKLIEDGLAEAQKEQDQMVIKLTDKTSNWYQKRGIKPRESASVTV